MAVEPHNTTIYLLTGVGLDPAYTDTYRFDKPEHQYNFFMQKAKVTIDDSQFQRVNSNTIKVSKFVNELYDCDYLMFKNFSSGYGGSKWFFAFITRVDYVNENCTEISYQIDTFQSWLFDFKIMPSTVVREHCYSDKLGEHTLPEPIGGGDYVRVAWNVIGSKDVRCAICLARPIHANGGEMLVRTGKSQQYERPGTSDVQTGTVYAVIPELKYAVGPVRGANAQANTLGCLPSPGYWYLDIPVFDGKITGADYGFYGQHNNITYKVDSYSEERVPVASSNQVYGRYYTAEKLLQWIGEGELLTTGSALLGTSDIIAVCYYPASYTNAKACVAGNKASVNPDLGFTITDPVDGVYTDHPSGAVGVGYSEFTLTHDILTEYSFPSLNGKKYYRAKNNRLYGAPYTQLSISSPTEEAKTYSYENFGGDTENYFHPTFRLYTSIQPTPQAYLAPVKYNGIDGNYKGMELDGISASCLLSIPYAQDAYKEWLTENRGRILSTISGAAIGAIGGAVPGSKSISKLTYGAMSVMDTSSGKATARNPATGRQITTGTSQQNRVLTRGEHTDTVEKITKASPVSGILGSANQIAGLFADGYQAYMSPPRVSNGMSSVDARGALPGYFSFNAVRVAVSAERAEAIDAFFTRYGYATQKIKMAGFYNRKNFQFIQTEGVNIHANKRDEYYAAGMGASDMQEIADIFNRGITMWNPLTEIGDYSDNPMIEYVGWTCDKQTSGSNIFTATHNTPVTGLGVRVWANYGDEELELYQYSSAFCWDAAEIDLLTQSRTGRVKTGVTNVLPGIWHYTLNAGGCPIKPFIQGEAKPDTVGITINGV